MAAAVDEMAAAIGETPSVIIREAIREYLATRRAAGSPVYLSAAELAAVKRAADKLEPPKPKTD